MATSSDGRILTVFWTIAEHPHSDVTTRKVEVILQSASKSIRQRLARENAFRKVPILNFINAPLGLPVGLFSPLLCTSQIPPKTKLMLTPAIL